LGAGSRGVHQYYLADDIAVYETMINAKTISTHVVRRMCDGDRPTHSSCPWAENVSPWLPDVSNTCSGTSSASCCWLGVQAFRRSGVRAIGIAVALVPGVRSIGISGITGITGFSGINGS
jgi:hypothetical protein